jgi:ABC-type glycerol-3-phosphate transport system substrate-binding protein
MTKRMRTSVALFAMSVAILAGCGSSAKSPPASPGTGSLTPTTVTTTTSNGAGGYGY